MTAKSILLAAIYSGCFYTAGAQVFVEVGPVQNNRDAFSSVTVYGSEGIRHKLPYEEIGGSPFWKRSWSKAFFYDQRDTFLGGYRARFNFVTNEVHYLDRNGAERAVIPGTLSKVIFMQEADSTAIATVFRANISEVVRKTTCKTCFVQELNQGHVKLLKITKRELKSKDSLFHTMKKYYFDDAAEYFLQYSGRYEKIKKLNKDKVFAFLPNISAYTEWIREKKLRFDKEEDFIYFINYYNAVRQNNLP